MNTEYHSRNNSRTRLTALNPGSSGNEVINLANEMSGLFACPDKSGQAPGK
ncbi:MAG: hypothetical protein JW723_07665 [Bacteroidales bacterium]|nr:hypothetical protein [Bacteroidales bacterium]